MRVDSLSLYRNYQKLFWKDLSLLPIGIRNHPPRRKRRASVYGKRFCDESNSSRGKQRKAKQRVLFAVETETLKSLFYRIPTAEIVKPITQNPLFNILYSY